MPCWVRFSTVLCGGELALDGARRAARCPSTMSGLRPNRVREEGLGLSGRSITSLRGCSGATASTVGVGTPRGLDDYVHVRALPLVQETFERRQRTRRG